MNQKFRDLVASLEPKYRALLEMEPVRFGSLPKEIPERGIYVFSEGGQHLYVGRTMASAGDCRTIAGSPARTTQQPLRFESLGRRRGR